jgi:transcriptional accessory protein Tex/SPT6
VRVERYGAFVDIGAERPGLLHVREMGQYVRNPADFVKVGEPIEVKILKLDRRKRQIDLTMNVETENEEDEESDEPLMSAMEIAYRQAQSTNRSRRERERQAKRKSSRDDFDDIYRRTLQQGR